MIRRYTGRRRLCKIRRHHDIRENLLRTDFQEAGGAQREWPVHLNFKPFFFGDMFRTDNSGRFGVAAAVATRDRARYWTLATDNVRFDENIKGFRATDDLSPLFGRFLGRVLTAMSEGVGDGLKGRASSLVFCAYPAPINRPTIAVLPAMSRGG